MALPQDTEWSLCSSLQPVEGEGEGEGGGEETGRMEDGR